MKQLLKLLVIYIAFGVVLFMVLSCDPIKRHARMVKKYPHVHVQSGVKVVHDTIRINTIRTDSTFFHDFDTIHIEKERLQVRLIRIRDSIYLQGECLDTTIYRQHTVNTFESAKVQRNWLGYATFILLLLLSFFTLRKIFK